MPFLEEAVDWEASTLISRILEGRILIFGEYRSPFASETMYICISDLGDIRICFM